MKLPTTVSTVLAAATLFASSQMGDAAPAAVPPQHSLNSRQSGSPLVCVANIVYQLNFTVPATGDIMANITLVGGGGGASGTTGRGGGGGSSALDIHGSTDRYYAAGGHGGYIKNQYLSYSGTNGASFFQDNVRLPAGFNITVTVGGGGGASTTSCTPESGAHHTTSQVCGFGRGGGGAGAYGGGGGGTQKDSGGQGGEAGGEYKGGQPGGHGTWGQAWQGGNGEDADPSTVNSQGAYGGSWAIGSQRGAAAGNGGGFGSGGGSCNAPMTFFSSAQTSWLNGGAGGAYGSNGGASRDMGDNGVNNPDGPNFAGTGACYMQPTGTRQAPWVAGAGGSGSEDERVPTYGGNAGYAVIVYYSPDGVNCPIESQTLSQPVGGNWCDPSKVPSIPIPKPAQSGPTPITTAASAAPTTSSAAATTSAVAPKSTSVPSKAATNGASLVGTFMAAVLALLVILFARI